MQLAAYLKKNSITATDFAKKIGLHHSSVLRFCDGTRRPNIATAAKIDKVTGGKVTLRDFLRAPTEAPTVDASEPKQAAQ